MNNDLREDLDEYAHDVWSKWMRHLFAHSNHNLDGSITIPNRLVSRWVRQMESLYKDLSEKEKNSDRIEADAIIDILLKYECDNKE